MQEKLNNVFIMVFSACLPEGQWWQASMSAIKTGKKEILPQVSW